MLVCRSLDNMLPRSVALICSLGDDLFDEGG